MYRSAKNGSHNKMTINSGKTNNHANSNAMAQSLKQANAMPLASGATAHDVSRTNRVVTATFALALGLCLLSVVGYAQATHDVAHDARHTFSFPCH